MVKRKAWREYFGCIIYYSPKPGALPWTAGMAYRRVAADTLEGIKALIREDMKPKATKR